MRASQRNKAKRMAVERDGNISKDVPDRVKILMLQHQNAELHEELRKCKLDYDAANSYQRRAAVALATAELAIAEFRRGH